MRSTASGRSTPRGFWAVWTAVALDLLGFGIIIPILPLYAAEFGADPPTIGLLLAAYSLAQLVFAPVWGRLSDRVGRKPVLVVTLVGSAVGSLVLALAGSVVILFVGRIVDGVSGASVAVARAVVADTADEAARPRLMGLLGAAFGVGFVLGPALGGLAGLFGQRVPFLIAAVIAAGNAVVTWRRLPETRSRTPAMVPTGLRAFREVGDGVAPLIVLSFVAVAAFSLFESTFALLAAERLALTTPAVSGIFALVGLVLVATQAGLVGPMSRRFSELALVGIGLGLDVGGFLAVAMGTSWLGLGLGVVLLAVGQGLATPAISSVIAGRAPTGRAGAVLGIHQSAGGLARVVGPVVGGVLYAVGAAMPYFTAAFATLGALVALPRAVLRPELRPLPPDR
ncbi:MAG TPA: MFS transporter [Actinobacteria bacterium]|nr:MFS transporter [Actinomycetota bacterium]